MVNSLQEAKLVSYICPTCGSNLKFENNSKVTTCLSCKNDVEKQFVINLHFVSKVDNSTFQSSYSVDKSQFKLDFDNSKQIELDNTKSHNFIEVQRKLISPSDLVRLDNLIQQIYLKFDNPSLVTEISDLHAVCSEICKISDENIYASFFLHFLEKKSLSNVLNRNDSLDKAKLFVPYLLHKTKDIKRYYDEELFTVCNYIVNCSLSLNEKYQAIYSILNEHLENKVFFEKISDSLNLVCEYEFSTNAKQNLVKKIPQISLLNSLNSFANFLDLCLKTKIDIDNLFNTNKLSAYLYGFNGVDISNLINFIWTRQQINVSKKVLYSERIFDYFLIKNMPNLTGEECAYLINSLKNKEFSKKYIDKILKEIVSLSLIEKVDIDSLTKFENRKIQKKLKELKDSYDKNIKIKRMVDRKEAILLNAEQHNRELRKNEEFENSQLICFLLDSDLTQKQKSCLINIIKIPYYFETPETIMNMLDILLASDFEDKQKLFKHFILNCLNLKTYKEALTILEFITRANIDEKLKSELLLIIVHDKLPSNFANVISNIYLYSYIKDSVVRFKQLFKLLCINSKDLFYQLTNLDIAFETKDIDEDTYLLCLKVINKFALNSVVKDHLGEVLKETKLRMKQNNIKEFSLKIKKECKDIINWLNKKPLNSNSITKDKFLKKYSKIRK